MRHFVLCVILSISCSKKTTAPPQPTTPTTEVKPTNQVLPPHIAPAIPCSADIGAKFEEKPYVEEPGSIISKEYIPPSTRTWIFREVAINDGAAPDEVVNRITFLRGEKYEGSRSEPTPFVGYRSQGANEWTVNGEQVFITVTGTFKLCTHQLRYKKSAPICGSRSATDATLAIHRLRPIELYQDLGCKQHKATVTFRTVVQEKLEKINRSGLAERALPVKTETQKAP